MEANIKLEEYLKKVQQENEDYKARMDKYAALSKYVCQVSLCFFHKCSLLPAVCRPLQAAVQWAGRAAAVATEGVQGQ